MIDPGGDEIGRALQAVEGATRQQLGNQRVHGLGVGRVRRVAACRTGLVVVRFLRLVIKALCRREIGKSLVGPIARVGFQACNPLGCLVVVPIFALIVGQTLGKAFFAVQAQQVFVHGKRVKTLIAMVLGKGRNRCAGRIGHLCHIEHVFSLSVLAILCHEA